MPRNTQSHNTNQAPATRRTTNQQQTRKRGESDTNEPPKRCKTRRSNNDSEADELEVEQGDQNIERRAGKAKQVRKKARYVFFLHSPPLPPCFFFLFFISLILTIDWFLFI